MAPEINKIVELYNQVQRIPYYALGHSDYDLLFEKQKGGCSEKHLFLGTEYKKLGIPVKYLVIKFDWNDLPIPKEIIKGIKHDRGGWHLALKIKPKDKWIYVDATWDPQLEKAGFPITKEWSGLEDTKLAVPPQKIIGFKMTPSKLILFIAKKFENKKFSAALNKWLESQRLKQNQL